MAIKSIQKEGLVQRKMRCYKYILDGAVAKEIKCVAGVGIGKNEIYWCLISRDCKVTRWSSTVLKQDKKYIPEKFVQQVTEAVSQIPRSDVTVVEAQTYKSSSRDPFLFPFILNSRLIEAVIHAVSKQPSVSMSPNIVKNYFKLSKGFNKQYYSVPLVDTLLQEIKRGKIKSHEEFERNDEIMCHNPEYTNIVESFIENQNRPLPCELKDLKISAALMDHFQNQKQKDGLANVLLLTFAFLRFEILTRC